MINKNNKLVFLLVISVFLLASVIGVSAVEIPTLRVSTWGGNYNNSYKLEVVKFEIDNNCKVEWVIGQNPEFLVKARNGQLDVCTINYQWALQGETEGLWLKLDPNIVTNMKDLYPRAITSEYVLWKDIGESPLVYNDKYIKEEPTSWNDLWNPEYKNRTVMKYFLNASTLELAILLAEQNGGGIDNIEPGIKKIADLYNMGNLIGMPESSTRHQQLFEYEEAWIGALATGRLKQLWDNGMTQLKMVRPKEGTFSFQSSLAVNKLTKYPELAQKFVNFAISPECQENFIINNLYAPTNTKTVIPEDFEYKDLIITGEEFDNLFVPDYEKMNAHKAEWAEMFDRLTTK